VKRKYWIALGIFLVVGVVLSLLLTFLLAPGGASGGQTPSANLDQETLRVAKGLYCPVCPGVPLDVCDTQACEQWRALIRDRLSQGQTSSQIESYFVEQYGERVLGAPRAQGLNLGVYVLPAFAVAAGAAFIYLFTQRAGPQLTPPQSPVSGDYRSRIERELQEND
jgi:cytochrome c-type biogenesis protein CcmH